MSEDLEFALTPERLDDGSPEEMACFGLLRVRSRNIELISGFDHYTRGIRPGPLVDGHALGEWLAWNWWKLHWEPRASSADWWRSHNMTAIGEGYAWPNLEIYCDGLRAVVHSRASTRPDAKPFRYLGGPPVAVSRAQLQSAVDEYMEYVLSRLRDDGISSGNIFKLWADVLAERNDPETARRRKLEALLGREPDVFDPNDLDAFIQEGELLGASAIEELAANAGQSGHMFSFDELETMARGQGEDTSPGDAVRLDDKSDLGFRAETPAWVIGSKAAKRLRAQEKCGDGRITDFGLARMAGIPKDVFANPDNSSALSFALDDSETSGRVVFRSRWKPSRRFDAARLIGDRALAVGGDRLRSATGSGTYRQKMQRSFAAEFLSPFDAVEEMLGGDYSAEAQEEVARHFDVSERSITTLLVNHRRIDREGLEPDLAPAA